MAVAPLESSSTPPDATSTDTTRSPGDSMEEIDPQSTRKRPRLDSGSGACEALPAPDETPTPTPKTAPDAPAAADQQPPTPNRPASRMTINMKSPTTPGNPPTASQENEVPDVDSSPPSTAEQPTNVVSISSSPAQSPEIEVAELEDMDQDPNTTSWKSLGEALRDPSMPDVVELRDHIYLPEEFPALDQDREPRENIEDACSAIEKASEHEVIVFNAVKHWFDQVASSLNQLSHESFMDSRYFWDEVPLLIDSLLRRSDEFSPDENPGFWSILEGYMDDYIKITFHLVRLDTLLLRQLVDDTDVQDVDLISRNYVQSLGWLLSFDKIPFYMVMHRRHGDEVGSILSGLNDRTLAAPMNGARYLSEYTSIIIELIPRMPQLAAPLAFAVKVVQSLAESSNDHNGYNTENQDSESPEHQKAMETLYSLIRSVDEAYQAHITKKSPWVTHETSNQLLRHISSAYMALCNQSASIVSRIGKDLTLQISESIPRSSFPSMMFSGWRFGVLKKHVMEGRMELRVLGIETMQQDFVNIYSAHMRKDPDVGLHHPLVQFMVNLLRESKLVEYIVGIDSHPQLISRSHNIVGFLVVTLTYTDVDTDTIWKTVTESPDPRTVSEVLGMLVKTFSLHPPNSTGLLYLCSKLLELPLTRFDVRMVEFCEQLFSFLRSNRQESFDTLKNDVRPLHLCVRLIRESAATEELAVDLKALLQKFASTQLTSFMQVGLSDADKMEIYERCVQDIAERNQFSVGSIQALGALLNSQDSSEIRKLAEEFNLTHLLISEVAKVVQAKKIDLADTFSRTGFISRVHMLARIIERVPDSISPELGDILWYKVFMSQDLPHQGRRMLWDTFCTITQNTVVENPFIECCIRKYLPDLSPADYCIEVLAFAKQSMTYEIRFNPPPPAAENEVVSIPGIDRIWKFILTAPSNTVEVDAISFAIEVYLDHNIIRRSHRSSVEATHMALVDRCVDQLKSAASKLKSRPSELADADDEKIIIEASDNAVLADELKFSRSLFFLRQFLQALRTRPQYSPPQNSPPSLPLQPVKGELINIQYQSFDGGVRSKVRMLRIGDLNTSAELVEALLKVTGYPKIMTISSGQKIDLLEKSEQTVRDLRLSGLLIVRRDPSSGAAGRKQQALTSVDTEVLKQFDDLYDLLNLDDHLAREIYDFLVVFPPQENVINLVKSTDITEEDMFPMAKPYNFLYSVNALSDCLRHEGLEATPSEQLVSHSVQVVVAALIRPEIAETLATKPTSVLFASSLIECLLYALMVKAPVSNDAPLIPKSATLVAQLLRIMEVGRKLPTTQTPEFNIHKLVCYSVAVFIEASVRDADFWAATKQQVKFDQLLFSLLIEESRQLIRRGVADNICLICSPSKQFKKPKLPASAMQEAREAALLDNPARIDILATIWDAFVLTFPRVLEHPAQSQEFFDLANVVFASVAEKSPRDMIFSEYLKQWSGIMLNHRTNEFVGREPVDYVIFGFSRLLKSCLDIASSSNIALDTFNLTGKLFDTYLFPDLSQPSSELITPQVPVMHTQTRQELYGIVGLLSKYDDNYAQLLFRLEDIIPQDNTYQFGWCFDRQKLIRAPEGYAGLRNLSNTCYLNSLLSQLFMNVGFREFMLQLNLTEPSTSQKLLEETKKVFGYMQESWLKGVDPSGFVDSIRTYDNEPVDVTIQMDVDEFYNLLFDRWEAQITGPDDRKKFRSFYGGQLVQQIKSKECTHISERLEPFSAIQCDIKGKASLEESLQAYVEGEIMQGDNKYSCTSCGRHVDAVKRACLKDVPDNLIFHLKRFDFDMVSMVRSKINDEFQFPERIDMTPFTVDYLSDNNAETEQDIFELVGVLVHSGTAESGHYYSYIRERPGGNGGTWVEFNDSDVSRFDPNRIAEQCFGGYSDSLHSGSVGQMRFNKVWNAYMLFYQRVSSVEAANSTYNAAVNNYPVRVPLPVPLANHIVMENELFVRTYCLLDPFYSLFVRYLFTQLRENHVTQSEAKSNLEESMLLIALDTVEQLITRTKDLQGFDAFIEEINRNINENPRGPQRVISWPLVKPAGIPHFLKNPHMQVRETSIRIFALALARLRDLYMQAEEGTLEKEKLNAHYLDGIEYIVSTLNTMWPTLHLIARSWDDYFEFLFLIANAGSQEAGIVLDHGFLLKCLDILWIDYDNRGIKRQYIAYAKLLEKGRKFSHRRLMDLLSVLLANIDFTARPISDNERQVLASDKYSLTIEESDLIRPLGSRRDLLILKKILHHYSSPQACRNIFGLLMDSEPEAGLIEPILQVVKDGLRLSPADRCTPFLEATLILCRRCPDENRIISILDMVAKGVDTINDSGGKEHLAFFTNVLLSRNERLGLDETWFTSQVIDLIPDWVPALLMYPEGLIRTATVDFLRRILFDEEGSAISEEWKARYAETAKDLVSASIDKLRKTHLVTPDINVEAKALEAIRTVIDHCLATYFGESEEDQKMIDQAQAVLTAIEGLAVDLPEELASGRSATFLMSISASNYSGPESDVQSLEEWEDNSMGSDSEMGITGTP
ncbi:putative ubiquitin C-terminal hydrolase [Aspergillus stella-maris]|uniref:putative ubiquitin C-terminal hydrolase n=1 Tax=Aspergillus stella-maris TaxID=1810926 RepID=UPI003CCCF0DA